MRVIGVGDNVVDKYLHKQIMYPGGNALNFSVYAKQMGHDTAYLGVFGNDRAARHIIETLDKLQVDHSFSRQHEGENGYAKVDLVDGDRVFVGGNDGGVQLAHPIKLSLQDLDYIKTFQLAHSSIYSDMETELYKIKEAGVRLSFDFSSDFTEPLLESVCRYADYSLLSCGHLEDEATRELLKKVHSLGSKLAIGTMGSRGALVFNGATFFQQEPHFVKPVDTLGAGDSFFTAFILYYLEGILLDPKLDFDPSHIKKSLDEGARFAAKTCLVDGAFGFGIPFNR